MFGLALVRNADLFVDFFFVLSGFVITHAYAERLTGRTQLLDFVIRRFGRLYPLHFFILLLFVGYECLKLLTAAHYGFATAQAPFSRGTAPGALLSNLLLIQGLGVEHQLTWNWPSWSISTEFFACLVFSAFCLLMPAATRQAPRRFLIGALLLAAIGAVVLFECNGARIGTTYRLGFFRCVYGFFTGVAVYAIWRSRRAAMFQGSVAEFAVACAVVLFVSFASRGPASLAAPLVFAAAVVIFAEERGAISRALLGRAAGKLGEWSYSIYMVHALVVTVAIGAFFQALQHILHRQLIFPVTGSFSAASINLVVLPSQYLGDLTALVYVMLVIGFASLTYRWVEVPGRSYFNRMAERHARSVAAGPGERAA